MTIGPDKSIFRVLLTLLSIQTACVSHEHQPDPAKLMKSANCEVVYGSYVVDSTEDGRMLAKWLFDADEVVTALAIEKTANQISFRGRTVSGQTLPPAFLNRFSCADSVLKLILRDQHTANGIYMDASDLVLELFTSDESFLNLRFINTTLAFFFIIPYYDSGDEMVTLQKQKTDLN